MSELEAYNLNEIIQALADQPMETSFPALNDPKTQEYIFCMRVEFTAREWGLEMPHKEIHAACKKFLTP